MEVKEGAGPTQHSCVAGASVSLHGGWPLLPNKLRSGVACNTRSNAAHRRAPLYYACR